MRYWKRFIIIKSDLFYLPMERMKEEKKIGTLLGVGNAFIPVHIFNGEEYVALFAFKEAIKGLEEENKKLKAAATMYRNDCKKLRAENEYLHKLLPEADGYIIEKQLEKRLWNDGEEDVYD